MGRRGPAPKPTSLKLLHGETRPSRINANEPMPRDELPVAPDWLSDATRAVWDYTVDQLAHMGVVTAADRDPLVVYCQAVVDHAEAVQSIVNEGVLVKGREDAVVKNPAFQIVRDNATLIRVFAQEFGLTPSARSGLSIGKGDDGAGAARLLS